LQDASCLINYELHWNPVRLMQRIGRVDRRRNQQIEDNLLADHPEIRADRDRIYYWNFLPPTELEQLLSLFKTVSQKTLRISKTFGIEGKQLLTPDDDYDALKEFNTAYEGTESQEEEIILDYQRLMSENPDYIEDVKKLPKRMFSGKQFGRKGFFFCYELPDKRIDGTWSDGDGRVKWYFYDIAIKEISDNTYEIWQIIKTLPDEIRLVAVTPDDFTDIQKRIETYIKRNYLSRIQAPKGVKAKMLTWMQLA